MTPPASPPPNLPDREATENDLFKNLHETIRSTAKDGVGKRHETAELVQKASAALVGVYTAVLGLVFVASDNPLPIRGVIPAFFLGLAVVLATAYAAWMTEPEPTRFTPADNPRLNSWNQTDGFVRWTRESTRRGVGWLRGAVVSLGIGLVLLPLPFLTVDDFPFIASDVPTAASTTPEISTREELAAAAGSPAQAKGQASASPPDPAGGEEAATTLAPWPTPNFGLPAPFAWMEYRAHLAEVSAIRAKQIEDAAKDSPGKTEDYGMLLAWTLALLVVVALFASWPALRRSPTSQEGKKDFG